MPPCAVPVRDRVGYSLEITAVRTRSDASMAARSPAPPAPTITVSYVWKVVMRLRRPRPLARVEREHDHRTQDEQPEPDHEERHVHREPQPGPLHVVLHDDPQPVDAVDQREHEQRPVPGSPERALPPCSHEPEVHAFHPAVPYVHDQHVPDGEQQQHQSADPHEQPRPQLEPPGRPLAASVAHEPPVRGRDPAFGRLDRHHRTPADSRMPLPMMIAIGIIARTNSRVDPSAIGFMRRAVAGQKSNSMIFTPLIGGYRTAATRPSSRSWTNQLWYTEMTRL